MRIEVHRDRCIGAGQCVMAAAEVFDQDDDEGYVLLLDATPQESLTEATRHAAKLCPASAIQLHDE